MARRIAVGIALGCLIGGTLAASALARSSHRDATFTAVETGTGRVLPHDPLLHGGETVVITVRGFAPHAGVTIGLVGVRLFGVVSADRFGHVGYRYTVPRSMRDGRHVLIFSGLPASLVKPKPHKRKSTRARDNQAFDVVVPFDPPWPFRLGGAPPPSTSPPSTHRGHGTGGQHDGTSFTGVEILGLVAAALLALVAGAAILQFARRRRRRS
jgi:hypothetical protein